MSKNTLGEFLLSQYAGALLPAPEREPVKPGTIGELVNPLDMELCEAVRFKFKDKIPMKDVLALLELYYESINWPSALWISDQSDICGEVWPAEAETVLGVHALYEKENGRENDILIACLNPILP